MEMTSDLDKCIFTKEKKSKGKYYLCSGIFWQKMRGERLARLKPRSASWTSLGHRMSLEVSCQHAIVSSVTLYTWYKTCEKLSRWSWLTLFEPFISLLLAHCIGPYLVQLFKESHIERQRKQVKGKHENMNRRGGNDMAIHEDFRMFDKKSPEKPILGISVTVGWNERGPEVQR